MKLEELIQKRFVSTAALAERLTTYNGVPAVFSPEWNYKLRIYRSAEHQDG